MVSAPFIGAFLAFVFLKEQLTGVYLAALGLMMAGTVFAVADTIIHSHAHKHHHSREELEKEIRESE